MEKITKILIACYKKDYYLTKICVASIRYFYPDIDIFLLKDLKAGDYSTEELQTTWNVKIANLPRSKFGWGLSKLEPLFFSSQERVLIIDSDIVFIGYLLDKLESIHADVIVSGEKTDNLNQKWVKDIYYDYDKVLTFDKDFIYPGFLFNTGGFVTRTGIFKRQEFEHLVQWNELPKLLHSDIFFCADQGILNYMVAKKIQANVLNVASHDFMLWGKDFVINHLQLSKIADKSNDYPMLIHWAGTSHFLINKMCRADILNFFEQYYYSHVSFGKVKRKYRNLIRLLIWWKRNTLTAIKKMARQIIKKQH